MKSASCERGLSQSNFQDGIDRRWNVLLMQNTKVGQCRLNRRLYGQNKDDYCIVDCSTNLDFSQLVQWKTLLRHGSCWCSEIALVWKPLTFKGVLAMVFRDYFYSNQDGV
ncbi:unnamed protein product [Arctogadus glacialis]